MRRTILVGLVLALWIVPQIATAKGGQDRTKAINKVKKKIEIRADNAEQVNKILKSFQNIEDGGDCERRLMLESTAASIETLSLRVNELGGVILSGCLVVADSQREEYVKAMKKMWNSQKDIINKDLGSFGGTRYSGRKKGLSEDSRLLNKARKLLKENVRLLDECFKIMSAAKKGGK